MYALLAEVAAQAAEVVHEAPKGGGGLPQMNADYFPTQLFWLAVTFLALWFVLARVALPRVGDVIAERKGRIKRDLEAAQRLKGETDKALADYEKALADARAKASGIAKDTREALAAATDAKKASSEKLLAAKLQEAETRIAATKTKALSAVSSIAAETAGAIVSKLIGQNVTPDEVKKVLAKAAGK